jgi:glutathione S-transferase
MPPIVGPALFAALRAQFRKQLYARGIGRHTAEIIAAKGRADVDALASFLGERLFLLAERPSTADTAVFGLLAPMVYWPMQTPVATHVKTLKTVVDYCDRMRLRCFGSTRIAA